jgi:hypothetical protein
VRCEPIKPSLPVTKTRFIASSLTRMCDLAQRLFS